uniref:Uncharacterized protein n=1 Tax=Nelumbo nucifera TaxID=4432 RepID=A0A822ZSB1_NELNU|nr:TPA_asm: hypothetical protein HUJ06_017690 [Nelumbo nucifera]
MVYERPRPSILMLYNRSSLELLYPMERKQKPPEATVLCLLTGLHLS